MADENDGVDAPVVGADRVVSLPASGDWLVMVARLQQTRPELAQKLVLVAELTRRLSDPGVSLDEVMEGLLRRLERKSVQEAGVIVEGQIDGLLRYSKETGEDGWVTDEDDLVAVLARETDARRSELEETLGKHDRYLLAKRNTTRRMWFLVGGVVVGGLLSGFVALINEAGRATDLRKELGALRAENRTLRSGYEAERGKRDKLKYIGWPGGEGSDRGDARELNRIGELYAVVGETGVFAVSAGREGATYRCQSDGELGGKGAPVPIPGGRKVFEAFRLNCTPVIIPSFSSPMLAPIEAPPQTKQNTTR